MSDKNKETELKEEDMHQATAEETVAENEETTVTEEAMVEEHEQDNTAKLEEEIAALKDKNLRLFAEFENHSLAFSILFYGSTFLNY